MHEHRFFIDNPLSEGSTVELPQEEAHHIARVLRVGVGDRITLFDGRGRVAEAKITSVTSRHVQAKIENTEAVAKPKPEIRVIMPWLRQPQRLDWAIEKMAELAVASVGVYDLPQGRSEKRADRWRRLTISAAKQSGAGWLTEVVEITDPLVSAEGVGLLLSEKSDAKPLRDVIGTDSPETVTLCVGPEAGFTEEAEREAVAAGWRLASIGNQRLRSETAAVVGAGAARALTAG